MRGPPQSCKPSAWCLHDGFCTFVDELKSLWKPQLLLVVIVVIPFIFLLLIKVVWMCYTMQKYTNTLRYKFSKRSLFWHPINTKNNSHVEMKCTASKSRKHIVHYWVPVFCFNVYFLGYTLVHHLDTTTVPSEVAFWMSIYSPIKYVRPHWTYNSTYMELLNLYIYLASVWFELQMLVIQCDNIALRSSGGTKSMTWPSSFLKKKTYTSISCIYICMLRQRAKQNNKWTHCS
jgi:hypothetical protein